jgi:hypothetical protein
MPRFVNLKGSMNPFDNNRPVLNSSDRTRNKKSKYIYAAAKQKFQTKRRCNGKNIKYYKKGTVRSVANYKLQQDLARGNVLCEDCDDKGSLCKGISSEKALHSIQMGNNKVSEFWGGGGLTQGIWIFDINDLVQSIAQPVIQSDISGIWGPASPPEVSKVDVSGVLPGSDPPANMPYGYINNLIKIPRNLNGSGIAIDPSNILFPANPCGIAPYMRLSKLKMTMIVSAVLPMPFPPFLPWDGPPPSNYYKCKDSSSNFLIGHTITLMNDANWDQPVANGVIKRTCCKRTIDRVSVWNPEPWTWAGSKVPNVGLFDIYIELFSIPNYKFLNSVLGKNPFYNPAIDIWYVDPLFAPQGWPPHTGDFSFHYLQNSVPPSFNIIWQYTVESIKIIQGTCDFNQTTGNKTKQSYMSCLEDKTKNINFTKTYPINFK